MVISFIPFGSLLNNMPLGLVAELVRCSAVAPHHHHYETKGFVPPYRNFMHVSAQSYCS